MLLAAGFRPSNSKITFVAIAIVLCCKYDCFLEWHGTKNRIYFEPSFFGLRVLSYSQGFTLNETLTLVRDTLTLVLTTAQNDERNNSEGVSR